MATSMQDVKPSFQPRITRLYSRWAESNVVTTAITRLQTWWKTLKQLTPKNTHDFITLEPLEKPIFLHVNDSGVVTAFSANTLANYFESSGDFKHPESRVPFNFIEIRRLDKQTGYVYNLCQNYDSIISRHIQERSQAQLEEFLINDLETNYQNVIASCRAETFNLIWERQMEALLPLFMASYHSLFQVNPNAAVSKLTTHLNDFVDMQSQFFVPTMPIINYVRLLVVQRYIFHLLGQD